MIIDKDKVKEAKEKLGEQNAYLISEILHIEEFDERNLKGLCPFHAEDTPSFIFNPKTFNFHCFGCGKNVDIIDAYIHQGATYVEAIQKLFDIAQVKYSFGEHKVQTRSAYRYPKPTYHDNNDRIHKYLESRGISKETAEYLDLRENAEGNILFPYYDLNDVLTMVKVRVGRKVSKGETKTWCLPGADTTPLLFNMNKVNTEMPLLITSGELDCAAAIEAGYSNTCSIPLGDQNTEWIAECWDFLEQFTEIIIAYDNDSSGSKFVKEIVPRLGSWRCRVVNIPSVYERENGSKVFVKDLNVYLYVAGKEKLLEAILNAKDTPVPSLIDFSDIEDGDLSDKDGIEFGIRDFDCHMMRLFYGSFNIVSGRPGSGKTSFLYQLICNAVDQNKKCWLFSKELPGYMTKNWLLFMLSGRRHLKQYETRRGSVYYKVDPKAKKAINEYYADMIKIYKDEWPNTLSAIKDSMVDSAKKYGSKLFILDNLTTIDLQTTSDGDKYDKQTELVNWLIEFGVKYDVCTILVAHPKKIAEREANIDMYDIGGTSNISNLAHRAFGLKRTLNNPSSDVVVNVTKDRLTGKMGKNFNLYYDSPSRRFFSNEEEFSKQYGWDQNTYIDSIPYPITVDDSEVFGKLVQ